MTEARFDDLTGAEPSFRLVDPRDQLVATRPDEVRGVLAAAEAAAESGKWVAGFVAYEAAPGLDPALAVRAREPGDPFATLPLAWFVTFEGRQETALPEPTTAPRDAPPWTPTVDRGVYDAAIATIHERIAAGDTYQVNHTLRLRAGTDDDPRGRYRDLCFAQRGAFAAYLDTGAHRVLSASPELFFRLDGDTITTRPMKGTAPRGRWPAEDDAVRERLEGSVKDRAENAMIVDLLRNDLGRVARRGTVRWDDAFEAERYETVWQLTTTVAATLRPDAADLPTIFAALFPSGSVTGAPKVATMRLIAALEDSPRGVYCGAIGFLAPPGSPGPRARFNVAIRTIVEDVATGVAEYGVGGGITWDSSAGAEYDETVAKAQVLTIRRPPFRLLETLAHDPAEGFRRLEHHLDRLRSSAAYFGFAYDEHAVRDALVAEAARFDGPARIRLLLDRRGRIETGGVPLTTPSLPLRLGIDEGHPVDPGDVTLFHKTTLRARYEEAIARHPGADDVILVNTRGEVTETTRANLAVRRDGRWWTPRREAGLLAGCEREALLADGTLAEATISLDDLRGAEDLAFVNSVRGWIPAVLADVAERR